MDLYVDLASNLSQDDLKRCDVDAELFGAIFDKLFAKSFHYPRIHGQRGAVRGIIRHFGPFSQHEVHHRVRVVRVETTMETGSMCIIVMYLRWHRLHSLHRNIVNIAKIITA